MRCPNCGDWVDSDSDEEQLCDLCKEDSDDQDSDEEGDYGR